MGPWLEIPGIALGSLLLWIAGTTFFDAVHWILHLMLGSRWRLLRGLAWPHGVHHQFLDEGLAIRWENQRRNLWCHLVPEYLTQLVFSAAMAWILPGAVVLGCILLQTLVFAFLLRYRGLDVNHRPIAILDAYRPSILCPPAYHALHHVYPGAYFSAYNKLVDWLVGGGAWLRGRRFALYAGESAFGRALRERLLREGAAAVRAAPAAVRPDLGEVDVLVLCLPAAEEEALVEAFVRATRGRQLPPEVWAVHEPPVGNLARHYYGDRRVSYRSLVLPDAALQSPAQAARAARVALFLIRRGLHYVPLLPGPAALRDFRRFRRSSALRPAGLLRARSRAELAVAS
jgi:hypothetical protein